MTVNGVNATVNSATLAQGNIVGQDKVGFVVPSGVPNGGDPNGYVQIQGNSGNNGTGAVFACNVATSAGTFTVPPSVLLAMPGLAGGGITVIGFMVGDHVQRYRPRRRGHHVRDRYQRPGELAVVSFCREARFWREAPSR